MNELTTVNVGTLKQDQMSCYTILSSRGYVSVCIIDNCPLSLLHVTLFTESLILCRVSNLFRDRPVYAFAEFLLSIPIVGAESFGVWKQRHCRDRLRPSNTTTTLIRKRRNENEKRRKKEKRRGKKEKREHSITSWNLFKFRSLSPVSMVVLYFEKGARNLL